MITCNLTKLETAVEQIRKAYPKLQPADAGRLASALVLTGRHAIALYDGNQYHWPEDCERLAKVLAAQLEEAVKSAEPVKKSKAAPEEEAVTLSVGLTPNFSAGEQRLEDRPDLKAALSDALQEGVEFVYSATDVGWQWALDRVNWGTVVGEDLTRRVRIKATFSEGAVGVEMGAAGKKKTAKAKAAVPVIDPSAPTEPVDEKEAAAMDQVLSESEEASIIEDIDIPDDLEAEIKD
ncbi:MAG: hypothetical protein SNJ74_09270 [Fimbriimonadaceae bacterium]